MLDLVQEQEEDLAFATPEEVKTFFLRIGSALKNPQLDSSIKQDKLNQKQLQVYEDIKADRNTKYHQLNRDVNACFNKLFWYINYLYSLCNDQMPMFSYYREHITKLDQAYLQTKIKHSALQAQWTIQEQKLRQSLETITTYEKRLQTKSNYVMKQAKDITDLERDKTIIENDRKR
mgnify:CR=1 FL=1